MKKMLSNLDERSKHWATRSDIHKERAKARKVLMVILLLAIGVLAIELVAPFM